MFRCRGSLVFFLCAIWLSLAARGADVLEEILLEPRYENLEVIGRGSYGMALKLGDHVMKVSPIDYDRYYLLNVLEASLLSSISHQSMPKPSQIKIHDGEYKKYIEIHLPHFNPLSPEQSKDEILYDMASLLAQIHSLYIAHRDIKRAHILHNGKHGVLIDWQAADIFSADPICKIGTTSSYCSPNLLLASLEDPRQDDMWALGVSMVEIIDNHGRLLNGKNKGDIFRGIFSRQTRKHLHLSTRSIELESRDGVLGLSSRLKRKIASADNKLEKKSLTNLFSLNPKKRSSAEALLDELGKGKQCDNTIFFLEEPNKTARADIRHARQKTLWWMHKQKLKFSLPDKVFFEAMSIADTFFSSSEVAVDELKAIAAISLYIAAGFYHSPPFNFKKLSYNVKGNFSDQQLKDKIIDLLNNADFKLIKNHSLRKYQDRIYHELRYRDMLKAIAMLTMLEIDEVTYRLSNHQKWALVMDILEEEREDHGTVASLIEVMCRTHRDHSIAMTTGYQLLCKE